MGRPCNALAMRFLSALAGVCAAAISAFTGTGFLDPAGVTGVKVREDMFSALACDAIVGFITPGSSCLNVLAAPISCFTFTPLDEAEPPDVTDVTSCLT